MKFLILSDTHIHAIADNKDLSLKLSFIEATYWHHKIIVTGDITDDGNEEQYANAEKLLKPFFGKAFLMPGNHDYGKLGNFYSDEVAHRFDDFGAGFGMFQFFDKQPVVYAIGNCLIILLNSNLETEDIFDFACGEIGKAQRDLLKAILESNPDKVKIVCLHHHPFIHGDPTMELNDAREFLRIIYRKADIVLFGHLHEKGRWMNKVGTKLILASGATYQEPFAWEIEVTEDKKIYSQEVPIC